MAERMFWCWFGLLVGGSDALWVLVIDPRARGCLAWTTDDVVAVPPPVWSSYWVVRFVDTRLFGGEIVQGQEYSSSSVCGGGWYSTACHRLGYYCCTIYCCCSSSYHRYREKSHEWYEANTMRNKNKDCYYGWSILCQTFKLSKYYVSTTIGACIMPGTHILIFYRSVHRIVTRR